MMHYNATIIMPLFIDDDKLPNEIYVVFSFLNFITLCTCVKCFIALHSIFRDNPLVQFRLFWRQLLALTLTCSLSALVALLLRLAVRFAHLGKTSLWSYSDFCFFSMHATVYSHLCFCIVNVHIAFGFFAVVYQYQKVYSMVRRTVWFTTFFLSFALTVLNAWFTDVIENGSHCVGHQEQHVYYLIIGSLFTLAAVLYSVGAVGLKEQLTASQLRAVRRFLIVALSYTIGIPGVCALLTILYLHQDTYSNNSVIWVGYVLMVYISSPLVVNYYAQFGFPVLGFNTHAQFQADSVRCGDNLSVDTSTAHSDSSAHVSTPNGSYRDRSWKGSDRSWKGSWKGSCKSMEPHFRTWLST